jgi:hypothetical protein
VWELSHGPNPNGGAMPGQLALKPKDEIASWPDQWYLHMLNRRLTTRTAEQLKSHMQISVLNLA